MFPEHQRTLVLIFSWDPKDNIKPSENLSTSSDESCITHTDGVCDPLEVFRSEQMCLRMLQNFDTHIISWRRAELACNHS